MFKLFKVDKNEALKKEIFKDIIDEAKIQKLINGGADIYQTDSNGRSLLHELAKKRKLESIKILLKYGIDLNKEDKYGKTVLNEAINKEDTIMIKFLLSNGACVNHVNASGRTILQDVAIEGNHRIFKILLAFEPDLTITDKYGKTVLFDAVLGGNLELVQDTLDRTPSANAVDINGQSAIFEAVLSENTQIPKYMIEQGLDVSISDKNRQNALFNAVILGSKNIEVIELLIKNGARLNQKDKDDRTLLDEILYILSLTLDLFAKVEGKYKLVRRDRNYLALTSSLIEMGLAVDRTDKDGKTLLFKEVMRKNYETLDFLLGAGIDINAVDKNGKTVLFYSILEGYDNIEMIDYLLKNGADINKLDSEENTIVDDLIEMILVQRQDKKPQNKLFLRINEETDYISILKRILLLNPRINKPKINGQTALFKVVLFDDLELIEVLLNNGADANLRDLEGNTPLSLLVDSGLKIKKLSLKEVFIKKLLFLLRYRVDINAKDSDGKTVLHKAVIADDMEVVEKLLQKKQNVNERDKQGRTPLHHTQWRGNYKIAHALIRNGADMNIPDAAGYTVLNYATILGHTKLIVILIKSGCLMYNKHKKSKTVTKFFLEKESQLDKILNEPITDIKLKAALTQTVEILKKEIHKVEM
ncbi:MAG: ankyrin repeat domain-containing protein [Arcobacteraceae bacterium]|nr:ankyrin repeat domain-containing protein [Arcobacteraceae bacterium]MDY0327017.1 ankyrin repeat domain-containing protein [Arcobacteraceae bacterium]